MERVGAADVAAGHPLLSRADSALGQSIDDKKHSPRKLALLMTAPAVCHLFKFWPTIIRFGRMGHAQSSSQRAGLPIMSVKIDRESNGHDASSKHLVVPPHEHGPDSACILSPGSKVTGKSAQRPRRQTIMTSVQFVPETVISRLLANPDPSREHSLAEAAVKPEIPDAHTYTPHRETPRPYDELAVDCLPVDQPPRVKPKNYDIWVHGESMSSVFRFPPPIVPTSTQNIGEPSEGNYRDKPRGFKMKEIGELIESYSKDCLALDTFVQKGMERVEALRDLASQRLDTSNQLMATMAGLTAQIVTHPGTEEALAQQKSLNTLAAIKSRVDAELDRLDRQLKEEAILAVKHTEMVLLAEFDPAAAKAIRVQHEEDLKIKEAQDAWAVDMTRLWRVKDGPQNSMSYHRSLSQWQGEATAKPIGRNKMSTYPTFRPTRPYRSPSPELAPPTVEEIRIPCWFTVLDAKATVSLEGNTPLARFKSLLDRVIVLETNKRQEEAGILPKKTFTKEWHDPDPRWPHHAWRKTGGWWICRSGPGASELERQCQMCHEAPIPANATPRRTRPGMSRQATSTSVKKAAQPQPAKVSVPEPSHIDLYEGVMGEIEEAMNECFEKDKMALHARVEMQKQLNEALDRARFEEEAVGDGEDDVIKVLELGPNTERRYRG